MTDQPKLNVEEILKTADMIEKSETYDQGIWFRSWPNPDKNWCGTPACIAGHVAVANGYNANPENRTTKDVAAFAQCVLGLDDHQASALFAGVSATNERAARTLRNLAATGKVDWYAK